MIHKTQLQFGKYVITYIPIMKYYSVKLIKDTHLSKLVMNTILRELKSFACGNSPSVPKLYIKSLLLPQMYHKCQQNVHVWSFI